MKKTDCLLAPDTTMSNPTTELGILQKGEESDVWNQFWQNAIERATFRKITRDSQPASPKPSSNDNDSMNPNIGGGASSTAPSRPFSAPGLSYEPGKRIDDIGKLTLDQVRANYSMRKPSVSSPPNPLKRGTRVDLNMDDSSSSSTDRSNKQESSAFVRHLSDEMESDPQILSQPETRPISLGELVLEAKGIYAGLIMVEAKCIDVDEKQSSQAQEMDPSRQTKLSNEQWQALIALHKTLLHEHHDFFLASQHPSASSTLSRLAAKYSMPARMWRHGIHAFLEVLRHRLPESLDHMLAFIYIAYSMMALLYETVSTFEDTWIECLGDLGRYRMAIEDDDIRDREIWSGVARFWYSKAADKSPTVGRFYHHLAILTRPYTLQQLSFYTKSLTCVTPFESARVSIMTLFNPILNEKEPMNDRYSSLETIFIKAHGMLFSGNTSGKFDATVHQILEGILDQYIGRIAAKFREQGVFAAVANIAALFEYGVSKSIFRLAFDQIKIPQNQREEKSKAAAQQQQQHDVPFNKDDGAKQYSSLTSQRGPESLTSSEFKSSQKMISHASRLTFGTLSIALQRIGDENVLPLIHVYFVFLWSLVDVEKAMVCVEKGIPWGKICLFLNHILSKIDVSNSAVLNMLTAEKFPQSNNGIGRPLPEEFIIRGQTYTQGYFPDAMFKDAKVDDEERLLEIPSMVLSRIEKILWLGFRIASLNRWIKYMEESKTFEVKQIPIEIVNAS